MEKIKFPPVRHFLKEKSTSPKPWKIYCPLGTDRCQVCACTVPLSVPLSVPFAVPVQCCLGQVVQAVWHNLINSLSYTQNITVIGIACTYSTENFTHRLNEDTKSLVEVIYSNRVYSPDRIILATCLHFMCNLQG